MNLMTEPIMWLIANAGSSWCGVVRPIMLAFRASDPGSNPGTSTSCNLYTLQLFLDARENPS